jgi:uncharacterized membrane protein YczE
MSFLSTKSVPRLFWSSDKPHNLRPRFVTFILLVIGLSLFGLGEATLIAADLGVSPWTVLAQGVVILTGWGIGQETFVLSVVVLVFGYH